MALEVVAEPLKSQAKMLVDVAAYAGTGNVLKIQHLLHVCSEHDDKEEKTEEEKKAEKNKKKDKDEKKKEEEKPAGPDLSVQQGILKQTYLFSFILFFTKHILLLLNVFLHADLLLMAR